ncbi:MAG TPA: DUF3048 domain-containing protein [Acidimicrobiales bacterium]|nr:DUF3048 domain-containing protein [Acidimicrobiales bacterium]
MGPGRTNKRWTRAAAGAVALGGLVAACGSSPPRKAASTTSSSAPGTTAAASTTTPTTAAPPPTCPLTDLPAPKGKVPQRPALAIKVENLPQARPQYGLAPADVVYEEPVEGGITRFIAIYQCQDSARVEPVRSGRLIDPEIVRQYGAHPLFGYSGAIQPAVDAIDSSPLVDVGVNRAPLSAYQRDPARYSPHNLMTSTAALYAYAASRHVSPTPPAPTFTFGPVPAGATPVASVHIGYTYSDLTWTWRQSSGVFFRSYSDTGPATLGGGGQITASNVVVMHVHMYPSQYVEDATGIHENLLTLTGSGPAQVFRNGVQISGTWNRPNLSDITSYLDSAGHPIPLNPGQTWVELVPTTVGVNVTP